MFLWQEASHKSMVRFADDSGRVIRLYKRKYDNQGAYFYMSSHVFPTLYIYSCDFIGQLFVYCQTVKKKFTSKSIASAFSNCPNIYMLIKDGRFENCHIEDLSINGFTKKCLAVCYPSFLCPKRNMYNRLVTMEKVLKEEVKAIKKYELKGKWDTVKKIGAGALRIAARVGVALVGGAVGGNLDIDLPDFDLGSYLPDVDIDFDTDMDIDTDTDINTELDFDTDMVFDTDVDMEPSMNAGVLSFQGKQILNIVGGGLQTIKVDDIGIPPGHATEHVLYKGVWHEIVNHKVKLDGHWWKVPR